MEIYVFAESKGLNFTCWPTECTTVCTLHSPQRCWCVRSTVCIGSRSPKTLTCNVCEILSSQNLPSWGWGHFGLRLWKTSTRLLIPTQGRTGLLLLQNLLSFQVMMTPSCRCSRLLDRTYGMEVTGLRTPAWYS